MRSIKIVHAESVLKLTAFAIGRIASHEHAVRIKAIVENMDKHDRFLKKCKLVNKKVASGRHEVRPVIMIPQEA